MPHPRARAPVSPARQEMEKVRRPRRAENPHSRRVRHQPLGGRVVERPVRKVRKVRNYATEDELQALTARGTRRADRHGSADVALWMAVQGGLMRRMPG
jgi:hypothetical protein